MRGEDAIATQAAHDALTLLALPRVGIREWHRRVTEAGDVAAALDAVPTQARAAAAGEAGDALTKAQQLGCRVLVHGQADYPGALYDLTQCELGTITPAPPILWALGDLSVLGRPTVALVGTRHATATGLRAAERLAVALAEAGATVISGLARGVDAAAHTGALDANGGTVAVIGTGIDIAYPADHRQLQRRIASQGLVLTEHLPGARANRGAFPERNRLIAALSQVTIVVEAGHKSGALLTARAAEALNRVTAAVPGAFDAAAALGSNELLRDGAQVIATVDDALALLHLGRADDRHATPPSHLSAPERAVWDVLGPAPLELDLVVERAGWAADACLAAVTTLELRGLVRSTHDGALLRT